MPGVYGLLATTTTNTKVEEVKKKIPDTNSLVNIAFLNTKIDEVENKIPDHAKYVTSQSHRA